MRILDYLSIRRSKTVVQLLHVLRDYDISYLPEHFYYRRLYNPNSVKIKKF